MRKLSFNVMLLLCAFGCCSLAAQGFSINKSSIKVEREFVKAPVFNLAQRTYKSLSKPVNDVKWLQFLVTYTPVSAKKNVVWEDDLSVEMMVLLPAKKGEGYGKVIMLTGKQVLFSVPGDGKPHYVLFQISPAILKKYTSFVKYDNRSIDSNVYTAVIFRRGKNNQVLAVGYGAMKNKTSADIAKLFEQYHNSKIGVMKLENAILPKEKTPWQWVDVDIFDTPKSMMEGNK